MSLHNMKFISLHYIDCVNSQFILLVSNWNLSMYFQKETQNDGVSGCRTQYFINWIAIKLYWID